MTTTTIFHSDIRIQKVHRSLRGKLKPTFIQVNTTKMTLQERTSGFGILVNNEKVSQTFLLP